MLMLLGGSDAGVLVGSDEVERLPGKAEVAARRHQDWHRAHHDGVRGPDGRVRRQSIALIAALYGVSHMTVRRGLQRAEEAREAIRRVQHLECGDRAAG